MVKDIFATKPDFVNEKNNHFWLDHSLTDYARKPNEHGTCLTNVQVFYVEFPNKERSRVVVVDGQPEFESTGLESIACHIDLLKFLKESETPTKP